MPTYNSEGTIPLALSSIRSQSFDQAAIEILVIDGGSSDRTKDIAKQFGCRVLDNPQRLPEYAKFLGIQDAKGRYAIFLDSDEVLADKNSVRNKISALAEHPEVKNVITAGLVNPPDYPGINDYANRFGEPFSFFIYRLDGGDYFRSLKRRYTLAYEDQRLLIVKFKDDDLYPICDGGGHCFDLSYLKSHATLSKELVPVIFPSMAHQTRRLAVIKDDFTVHYSTASLQRYVRKLHWRVVTSVFQSTGTEGFVSRQRFHPRRVNLKKYLFIAYAFTLIGPFVDAVNMALSRRNIDLLIHFPLTLFTACDIGVQHARKLLRLQPRFASYGE